MHVHAINRDRDLGVEAFVLLVDGPANVGNVLIEPVDDLLLASGGFDSLGFQLELIFGEEQRISGG
jgi:hypothetical protein